MHHPVLAPFTRTNTPSRHPGVNPCWSEDHQEGRRTSDICGVELRLIPECIPREIDEYGLMIQLEPTHPFEKSKIDHPFVLLDRRMHPSLVRLDEIWSWTQRGGLIWRGGHPSDYERPTSRKRRQTTTDRWNPGVVGSLPGQGHEGHAKKICQGKWPQWATVLPGVHTASCHAPRHSKEDVLGLGEHNAHLRKLWGNTGLLMSYRDGNLPRSEQEGKGSLLHLDTVEMQVSRWEATFTERSPSEEKTDRMHAWCTASGHISIGSAPKAFWVASAMSANAVIKVSLNYAYANTHSGHNSHRYYIAPESHAVGVCMSP